MPNSINKDTKILDAINTLKESGDYQVLQRLKPVLQYNPAPINPTTIYKVCILDTETTGLDTDSCEIIELGYQIVEFDTTGCFYKVLVQQNFMNEPQEDIPEEVSKITGITMQDVRGQKIPWQQVVEDIKQVDLIVAHNAGFDRPVVEGYNDVFKEKVWGCSVNQIAWFDLEKVSARNQDFLCWKIGGVFYDAHRALTDVQALTHLLSCPIGEQSLPAFHFLLKNVRLAKVLIKATSAPFEVKDALKQRRYRWNPAEKVWQTIISKKLLEEELVWLKTQDVFNPTVNKIKSTDTFSVREK